MKSRYFGLLIAFTCYFYGFVGAAAQSFEPLANFPDPALGSYTVVGTGLPDGRFVLWNGDRVFVQDSVGGGMFIPVASGYGGDPGFAAVSPDGSTLLLGGGFTPKLYRLTVDAWQNHSAATELDVPTHYAGVYLSDTLVALDRGKDDFSGAEIIVVDISGAKSAAAPRVVLSSPPSKAQVVDKPPFAYSAQIAVDDALTTFYVMDGNTRELRAFAVADLIDAYTNTTPLDWSVDGLLIGAPGDYFNGGPAGVLADGNLVVGGAEGFGQPGGIQIVDPGTGAIAATLDPTGTQQYISVIFNPGTDAMIGLDGFNFQAYATTGGVADLPATDFAALVLLAIALSIGTTRYVVNART